LGKKKTAIATPHQPAVLETSVLVNFLKVDRVDLLAQHPHYRFIVTDHVRLEITSDYPDQLERLETALSANYFDVASVDALDPNFVELARQARYGTGECAAIALAVIKNAPLAIDDNRASKAAKAVSPTIQLENTETLMIALIKSALLDVPTADAIKLEWEAKHRFKIKFKSFAERL
jgi:predicted nucleic acid-binding protein